MIKVLIEVGSGNARLSATVQAETILRAVGVVETRYPGSEARVVHPIDPEAFFVKDSTPSAEVVELEMLELVVR